MTDLYKKLNDTSYEMGESADCSVISIAAVCGITYKQAHKMCKKAGRKNRQGMRTITMLTMLEDNGYYIESNKFSPKQPNGSKYTPKTIEKAVKLNKRYLAFTRDHVFAIVEKDIIDWVKDRRHHIERLVEVVDVN